VPGFALRVLTSRSDLFPTDDAAHEGAARTTAESRKIAVLTQAADRRNHWTRGFARFKTDTPDNGLKGACRPRGGRRAMETRSVSRCVAIAAHGKRCQQSPFRGSPYCWHHTQ